MKGRDVATLFFVSGAAAILILFSPEARQGAEEGLILSQHTIIPSLLPLLILFLIIMKSGARDVLARLFGRLTSALFALPYIATPAIIFGLIGGYPTGALLTKELFDNEEISTAQAKRMMSFNFCGGCGFIITALGTAQLKSHRAGVLLFLSNVLSAVIIGVLFSLKEKRSRECFYSFAPEKRYDDVINSATSSAVSSVLNIAAVIMLFSAVMKLIPMNDYVKPLLEITSGLCTGTPMPLPLISAYLSFGGVCIHLQLLGIIKQLGVKYYEFFLSRLLSAGLSALMMKLLLLAFPTSVSVFSNASQPIALTSVNYTLSALMIAGCFVLVLDLKSKRLRV